MSIDAVFPAMGGIGIFESVTQPFVLAGTSGRRVGAMVPAPGATVGATVGAGQVVAAAVGATAAGGVGDGAAAGAAQARTTDSATSGVSRRIRAWTNLMRTLVGSDRAG